VRIQQVSAWAHVPDTSGLQLKCPAADMAAGDVDRYTTDLVLGVTEPVHGRDSRGLLHLLEMTETVEIRPIKRMILLG
jgi:hypothetical protein